jgi:hypothetical protein
MASLPADGLDDLLFEFYKKEVCILFYCCNICLFFLIFLLLMQVLKHLITKMTPEMVRTLRRLKVSEQFIVFRKMVVVCTWIFFSYLPVCMFFCFYSVAPINYLLFTLYL